MNVTFQPGNQKNGAATDSEGNHYGKSRLGEKDKEQSFGNVNFEMPMGHLQCIVSRKLNSKFGLEFRGYV